MKVGRVDNALAAAGGLGMHRYLPAGVGDANLPARDDHLHALADQPPWHAVAVAVDRDRAICLHPAHQLAHLAERRPAIKRPERRRLLLLETHQRHLAGGAVNPPVGDLAHPPVEMRLERRPARESMAGNGVALDVADAALVLALGAGPIRRASVRMEAPIAGKGVQTMPPTPPDAVDSAAIGQLARLLVPTRGLGVVDHIGGPQRLEPASL